MNAKGDIYVLEVNPLPGLTPDYSDLCLIAKAAGIDYRSLIGEILAGGLKRLREKRRAEAAKTEAGGANAAGHAAAERASPPSRRQAPSATATVTARRHGKAATRRRHARTPSRPRPPVRGPRDRAVMRREPERSRRRLRGRTRTCDDACATSASPSGAARRGRCNAITDVKGVRVGHTTLIEGEGPLVVGKGPGAHRRHRRSCRRLQHLRAAGAWPGAFVLNGAGEVSGLTQVAGVGPARDARSC